jgi:hypothetical protein
VSAPRGPVDEIIERRFDRLRREVLTSGAATIEGVRRDHEPGSELRYELLLVVTAGWVTTPPVRLGEERSAPDKVSDDANVATLHRVLEPWLKRTVVAVDRVAEVVRCELTQQKMARGLPPEYTVQIVVRVPNAAAVGLPRTTRAVSEGGTGLPGPDHVQSAVRGRA